MGVGGGANGRSRRALATRQGKRTGCRGGVRERDTGGGAGDAARATERWPGGGCTTRRATAARRVAVGGSERWGARGCRRVAAPLAAHARLSPSPHSTTTSLLADDLATSPVPLALIAHSHVRTIRQPDARHDRRLVASRLRLRRRRRLRPATRARDRLITITVFFDCLRLATLSNHLVVVAQLNLLLYSPFSGLAATQVCFGALAKTRVATTAATTATATAATATTAAASVATTTTGAMAQWTDPSRQFLIQCVRTRKVLWDKELATDAQCKAAKCQAFQEVTDELNETFPLSVKFSCEDVRSQWKNLKDTFVRKLRWVSEGKYSEDPLKEPTWKFYRMLSFLDEKECKRLGSSCDEPNFDIVQLQREHDALNQVKTEMHHLHQYENSNHSTTSSEEQMMQMFSGDVNYGEQKQLPTTPCVSPPSPALPPVVSTTAAPCVDACAKPSLISFPNGSSGSVADDDDEPRRKRVYHRRVLVQSGHHHQDEFELFGAFVASQLKRVCEEGSRSAALRLQKRLHDLTYEAQIALLER